MSLTLTTAQEVQKDEKGNEYRVVTINVPNEADAFGRFASERIIELSPEMAQAINDEVTLGEHDTFDDAIEHVFARGFAEIKRTRDAANKLKAQRQLAQLQEQYNKILKQHPELAADPKFVSKMLAELGIAPQTSK